MNKTIILVDLPWERPNDPRRSLGHETLCATLRQAQNLHIESVVIPVNSSHGGADRIAVDLAKRALAFGGRVDVAFGAYVWNDRLVTAVSAALRAHGFAGRIVLGGPQISYAGRGLESLYPHADVFIRGFAEQALFAFLQSDEPQPSITGIHFAGSSDRLEQACFDPAEAISSLLTSAPPVYWAPHIRWETQRGCPYRCAFCQHRAAGKPCVYRFLRERLNKEIELLCAAKVQRISVLDPVFNISPDAIWILKRFAALNFKGQISLQCRTECITPAFLNAAARLNVVLELGLQSIHCGECEIIGRRNDLNRIAEILKKIQRHHIQHEVSLIYGLPMQTPASFEASIAWCKTHCVQTIRAFPLALLRGTQLEKDKERWGLECVDDPESGVPHVVRSSAFAYLDWLRMREMSLDLAPPAYSMHHRSQETETTYAQAAQLI